MKHTSPGVLVGRRRDNVVVQFVATAELQLRSLNMERRKWSLTTGIHSASAFGSGYFVMKSCMGFWGRRACTTAAAAAAGS
jgi:hypothetical protein